MRVVLVDYPRFADYKAYCAAKVCYSERGFCDIWDETHMTTPSHEKVEEDRALSLLKELVEKRHGSILEHCCFTFSIEGISRACSHQLVRHRIASYSQQSQRYVRGEKFGVVIPPSIEKDENALHHFNNILDDISEAYTLLVEKYKIPKEDARYLLPNATTTNLVVTMNARELLHFIELRMDKRAQWEIRELAKEMLAQLKEVAPVIFGSLE